MSLPRFLGLFVAALLLTACAESEVRTAEPICSKVVAVEVVSEGSPYFFGKTKHAVYALREDGRRAIIKSGTISAADRIARHEENVSDMIGKTNCASRFKRDPIFP